MTWFGPWFGAEAGGGGGETTPPTVTKLSPSAFDADFGVAAVTPIVIRATDSSGIGLITVIRAGAVVYYGTAVDLAAGTGFAAQYAASTVATVSGGYSLSILPSAGWQSGDTVTLVTTAVDLAGNYTALTTTLAMPAADEASLPTFLRDSVWRWRRRLRRRKCSVISVAIDDRYSVTEGFTLTALALEIGMMPGLDRVPWRGGTVTSPGGTNTISNGR